MIPNGSQKEIIQKQKENVKQFPDPVCCSEKGCDELPIIAYWLETWPFRFACEVHRFAHETNGKKLVEQDNIEDYNKKRKRKIYIKHFREYL